MDPSLDNRIARGLVALTRSSLDHPYRVLVAAAFVTVLSVLAAARLRLDTDLKSLLPPHTPSVARLEALAARIGGQSDLIVEIRSPDPEANKRFGEAITAYLRSRADMRFTIFRRDKEVLERSVLLFLSLEKLDDLRERVKERLRREVRKQLALEEGEGTVEDADDAGDDDPFEKMPAAGGGAARSEGRAAWTDDDLALDEDSLRERFKEVDLPEYLSADEGRVLVVKARPAFSTTDVKQTRALIGDVRAEIARLAPSTHHAQMEVSLEGLYADMTSQVDTLRNDILGSTSLSFLALFLCIVAYFRRVRPLLYIFVPLTAAMAWSLGVAWLFFGGLNLVSAFILAILLGLGIDYGTHMMSRYREELAGGLDWRAAYLDAVATTGHSVFTGAATTAVVFFVLAIAHFRGFSQFGVVAGFGVFFSLVAVYTVTPAMLALVEPRVPWRARYLVAPRAVVNARPGFVAALAIVVLVVAAGFSAFSALSLGEVRFEYDFGRLGPRGRADPDSGAKRVDFREAVGRVTTGAPAVIMAETPADAEAIFRDLARFPEAPPLGHEVSESAATPEGLPDPTLRDLVGRFDLATVDTLGRFLSKTLSLYSFVPEDQEAKLSVLKDIRRRLEQKRDLFRGKDRDDLDRFLAHVATQPLTVDRLPEWIRAQFRTLDGREGTFVLLYTRGSKDSYINASRLKRALFDVNLADGRTLPTAANFFVLADVIDTVEADAPKVMLVAFAAILLLVGIQLRRFGAVLLVVGPLALSLLWVCGYLVLSGMKLNFYNMILLPLLIGMGVDASLHVVARYREEGPGSLPLLLRETGGAVHLAVLTTAIGFGGVYYADHVGINSMGTLGIVGIYVTFAASILVVPSILWVLERNHRRSRPQ